VKLVINGIVDTYYIAVLSSPASNFRWAYLYKNQKQDVFMDSHVKFFEMVQGVYKEVVYDNMKNVVTKFIGRNEKELNKELIKLSLYYGFDINVTNCFKGNEKGHVEGSVKIIRNKIFATNYKFKNFEEACTYLNNKLITINENSSIKDELKYLLPYKPKLELAKITTQKVNKYSFVRIDNNFYSVPEYLVDKKITAKIYYDNIIIFSNDTYVCEHKKIDGFNEISIDIKHYLNSLFKKPGAIRNSLALKSIPKLKSIYDNYFSTKSKEFIEILRNNNRNNNYLSDITRNQTNKYNQICIKGVK